MPCPPDNSIYHAMSARPYHIPGHAGKAVPYICHPARPNHIPSHTSPGNTIYHAMPTRPYHISCHALQAIPYTMPCPADHIIYHVMSARPYHKPSHVGCLPSISSLKGPKGLITRCTIVMSIVKEDDSFL